LKVFKNGEKGVPGFNPPKKKFLFKNSPAILKKTPPPQKGLN